ncbi:MAG TPA: alpha/beta hydrolase [Archangium sp.]|nr:alpha/beta hydrolase [Archangium sp.]
MSAVFHLGEGIAARSMPGPGDKVLWLHGYTIDSSAFGELWELLPGWHHLGIDLPGHGASRPLEAGEELPSLARRLVKLALEQQVRHLVALSFGTLVATQMVIEHPTAFASLTLGAPSLAGGPMDPDVENVYVALGRLYRERGPGPHLRTLWMTSPPYLFKGAERRPGLWHGLSELVERHRWEELGSGAMQSLTARPQRESGLRRIQSATLVLLGEEELPAYRRCAEILRRSVGRCERRYLPGVGHLCMLEAPELARGPIDAHLRAHAAQVPPPG